MVRRLVLAAAVLCVAGGCASGASDASSSSTSGATSGTVDGATGTTVAVDKHVLATQVDPPGAPGMTLTLIEYTIAPGAKLSPHIHPGIQLASITSGELTYTVLEGTVVRTLADGSVQDLVGPTTVTLEPGDAVAEVGDAVHFGANDTDEPIVITATLLTEDGQDLAVTVTTTSSTTATP